MYGFVADLRFRFERRENADAIHATTLLIFILLLAVHKVANPSLVLAQSRLDGTHAFLDLLLFREPITSAMWSSFSL